MSFLKASAPGCGETVIWRATPARCQFLAAINLETTMGDPNGGTQGRSAEEDGQEKQSKDSSEGDSRKEIATEAVDGRHNGGAESESWPLESIKGGRLTVGSLRQEFDTYSKAVSDMSRQLNAGGFAVAWLFHETVKGPLVETTRLPSAFWPAVLLFIVSAFCDFQQYVTETELHRSALVQTGRLKLLETDTVDLARGVHTTAHRLFDWKRYTLIAGYVALAVGIGWVTLRPLPVSTQPAAKPPAHVTPSTPLPKSS